MTTTPIERTDTGLKEGVARQGDELVAALRGAWVDVDLDALETNLTRLEERLARPGGETPGILAVLKADAYGHGATRVARTLEELGVADIAVALLEEGAEMRRAGVEVPILALGPAHGEQLPLYRRYRITPTVSSLDQLALWREWARGQGGTQPIHLKVDTGMTRLGIALGEVGEALERIRGEPHLELTGLLSHFAEAEEPEGPRTAAQEERFDEVVAELTPAERRRVAVHLANSAGALHRPTSRHDLVRLGLSLFGHDPAGRVADLSPVMAVAARIVSSRQVAAGTRLGYGGRYQLERPSRVAVVPVGYGDGYPWRLGNRASALVRGRRVPVAGAVSMDMLQLDVSTVGESAGLGTEVVLLGRQGDEVITAAELADRADTISYEVLCRLGQRLPRRYFRHGRLCGAASPLTRRSVR